jgi:hypothetical protein
MFLRPTMKSIPASATAALVALLIAAPVFAQDTPAPADRSTVSRVAPEQSTGNTLFQQQRAEHERSGRGGGR